MVRSFLTPITVLTIAFVALALLSGCGGTGGGGGFLGPNAQGGTVTSSDGNASLVLQNNSGIPIKTVQVNPDNAPPQNAGLVSGTAYTFTPNDTIEGTGTITIKYNPANVPMGDSQSSLALFMLTGVGWTEVAGSSVDTSTDTVTGQVTSMGIYAVISTS